jgi:dipeptidase E
MVSRLIAIVIAIGSGGFLMEPENPLLDQYCLDCTGKASPKVCFIPTASGDSEDFLDKFYRAFARYSCTPSHLAFFRKPRMGAIPLTDLESHLLAQDLIYVGGGNTRSMLAVWREWHVDKILSTAWRSGILLAGMSAGAICWFDYGCSDSISSDGQLGALPGLGLIRGSCTPHYDGEAQRRPNLHRLIKTRAIPPGIGIDDGAAVLFTGQTITEVVASRPTATAYRVNLTADGQIAEEPMVAS